MKISVLITSYNQRCYLSQAIESVLNQTVKPFEVIIVDDCSTDGSRQVVEQYASSHPELVRAFYHSSNQGIANNRNFALKQAKSELVIFLDGDDRFLPRNLEVQLDTLLKHPNVDVVYPNVFYIDAQGKRRGVWDDGTSLAPTGYVFPQVFSRDSPRGMLFRNYLVRYVCLNQVGLFDPSFSLYEDWELLVRLSKQFCFAYSSEPLVEYRLHAKGISRSSLAMHLDAMRRVYEKDCHLLSDLPEHARLRVEKMLFARLAKVALLATWQDVRKLNVRLAFRSLLAFIRYTHKSNDS